MEAQDRLLKTPEVAQRYGCSVRTVIRMRQRGEGPRPVPIGPRMLRYLESEVERYLGRERESDVSDVAECDEAESEDS